MDVVLSICLQSDIPAGQTGKLGTSAVQLSGGPVPTTSVLSGSSKSHPMPGGAPFKTTRDRQAGKRKDLDSMFNSLLCDSLLCYSMLLYTLSSSLLKIIPRMLEINFDSLEEI